MDGRFPELYWDSTYAICMALIEHYPNHHVVDVGLAELTELIIALPGFSDDPDLVTERILLDVQNVWYEETYNT